MKKAVWGARMAGVFIMAVAAAACGDLTRQGTSSSYLVIRAIEAASGADDSTYSSHLLSDVITVVDDVPTFFNDPARVQFGLGLKDPGTTATPAAPTQANWITVDRYHVRFVRADGRNTPGVDVPYEFDGAFTVTVNGDVESGFNLVRHQAKIEAPLAALARNGQIISTLAEITFYGHDQTGRQVSAVGRIGVDFGNFGDPK